MLPLSIALLVMMLALVAEWLHLRRIRVAARLAFGPQGTPRRWIRVVPGLRVASLSLFTWGLLTLFLLSLRPPLDENAKSERLDEEATRVIFVGDLSPSMFIEDGGPEGKITRHERMREVVDAILQRVSGNLRFGVIGFYTESLPIVMEARDPELVRNVFNGLPVTYAMPHGQTDLGKAVNAALELVAEFPEDSTRLILLTDGDSRTLAPVLPRPASIEELFVLGVGNPDQGTYIDGHQSRQETHTLERLASSLAGSYENVNETHLSTEALGDLVVPLAPPGRGLSLSQWAVLAMIVGASVLAFIPVALDRFGTEWKVFSRRVQTKQFQKRKEAAAMAR